MRVSQEQFEANIPRYVERARTLSRYIFKRALVEPSLGIQLQATIFNARVPGYDERVSDRTRLKEFWQSSRPVTKTKADVPFDNMRLAIESNSLKMDEPDVHIRVWPYALQWEINEHAIDPRHSNDQAERNREKDWVQSAERSYSGNLVAPAYSFALNSNDPKPYDILAHVYTPDMAADDRTTISSAMGLANIPLEAYQTAIAPPYSAEDKNLLEKYGRETYHTHKIERLLRIMAHVAGVTP